MKKGSNISDALSKLQQASAKKYFGDIVKFLYSVKS